MWDSGPVPVGDQILERWLVSGEVLGGHCRRALEQGTDLLHIQSCCQNQGCMPDNVDLKYFDLFTVYLAA